MKTNIYGRVLPIDAQEATHTSACIDCGHPHYDTLKHRYVRCGACGPLWPCDNVGANDFDDDTTMKMGDPTPGPPEVNT
jgi:hypothetical protein